MVDLKPEENFESMLRRFKREVALDGTLRVYREKSRFETERIRMMKKRKRAARRKQR